MLTLTLMTCLVGLSPVGPMPDGLATAQALQTGTMIDIPDNARVRGPDEPAITVVGGVSSGDASEPGVELGAFGSPIIARSDLVMRSFDKGVNFTIIKYPRGFQHGHHSHGTHSPTPAARQLPLDMQPIESRFPPSPGR